MTTIKLYYNNVPGQNLHDDDMLIWQGSNTTSFHHILNTLGLDYEWTTNPHEGIVVLDIGSTSFDSEYDKLIKVIDRYSADYGKFLLFTSQEPINKNWIDFLETNYPNIFIMDIKYAIQDKGKYIPFPAFFARMNNNILNEVIPHAQINLTDVDKKTFKFHNLKYRWTHDKFYTQYYLDEYDLINDNIITYQNPSKFDLESGEYIELDPKLRSDVLLTDKSITADNNLLRKMVSALETFDSPDLVNDKEFNVVRRFHPQYIYDLSYFSLVNENLNKTDVDHFYISEKTLYPMLVGHPTLIIGNQWHNEYMADLGFLIYDELFDYSFDQISNDLERIDAVVNQASIFSPEEYVTNIDTVIKKVEHNKYNLTNNNSKLWTKLRQTMTTNLEKYNDTEATIYFSR